jgi:hypothetical protein
MTFMLQYISIYVLAGILVNLLYDLLISYMGSDSEHLRLSIGERFAFGLLWPLSLTLFIINFIKSFHK